MRVLVFGDSIAYGAWDTEGGWVDRLKRGAHSQTVKSKGVDKLQIINLGIGGDTSTKILSRMEKEIESRHSASWPFAFVFAFGSNDERSINGEVETPLEAFKQNVGEIVNVARKYTSKILFLGIPPIGGSTAILKGQEYSDERIKIYERVMEQIVEAEGMQCINIRAVFAQTDYSELFSYDNIHPSNKGHELIAEAVESKLKLLIQS
jgi:lysophospholipase L1-like esterase